MAKATVNAHELIQIITCVLEYQLSGRINDDNIKKASK